MNSTVKSWFKKSGDLLLPKIPNLGMEIGGVTMKNGHLSYDKVISIHSLSDFPAPVGGFITLDANTDYQVYDTIDMQGNGLIMSAGTQLSSPSPFHGYLVNGHVNGLINSTDVTFTLDGVNLVNNPKVFNCTDSTGLNFAIITKCGFGYNTDIGTLNGFGFVSINYANHTFNLNGWTFTNITNLGLTDMYFNSTNAGTAINIPSGVFGTIIIQGCAFQIPTPGTSLNISSGITLNNGGQIVGNLFTGTGNRFTGGLNGNSNNYRWRVKTNGGLSNFVTRASIYADNNTGSFTALKNVWTKVTGITTLTDILQRFTHTTPNRVTYVGQIPIDVLVRFDGAFKYVSNSSHLAQIGIFKNGTLVTGSGNAMTVYTSDEPVSTTATLTVSTNDYLELGYMPISAQDKVITCSFYNLQVSEIQ